MSKVLHNGKWQCGSDKEFGTYRDGQDCAQFYSALTAEVVGIWSITTAALMKQG